MGFVSKSSKRKKKTKKLSFKISVFFLPLKKGADIDENLFLF